MRLSLVLSLLAACQPAGPRLGGADGPREGHDGALRRGTEPPVTASFTSTTTVLSGPTSGYAVGADVNGDGYRDVVVTRTGSAWVFRGGAAGLSSTASQTFTAPTGGGARLFYAGDIDHDGDEEVLFTRHAASKGRGAAWLCRGTPSGLSTSCRQVATGAATTTGLGVSAAAGDLNGDGYADLAIAANDGTVSLLRGGTGAGRPAAWTTLTVTGTPTGFDLAVGNFDGDGYDDVAVGRYQANGMNGRVYVYFGAVSPPFRRQTLDHPWEGDVGHCGSAGTLGYSVGVPGDVDGDGRDELYAGAPYDLPDCVGGYAYLFYGAASGLETASWSEWMGTSTNIVGLLAPGRGDYNHDGTADVVQGATELLVSYSASTGFVRSEAAQEVVGSAEALTALGTTSAPGFVSVGDVNGDGYDDVLATTPAGLGTRLELFYGDPSDLDGDGYSAPDDCDESDPAVFPGAPETCGDGVDSDCAGGVDECDSSAFTAVVTGQGETTSYRYPFALDADLTGDGAADLLVGRPLEGELQLIAGPVAPGMSSAVYTRFTEASASSSFGAAVFTPDLDGDGDAEIVTTAPYADTGANATGSVYVYEGSFDSGATRGTATAAAELSGASANANLCTNAAMLGDVSGDGLVDLVCSRRVPASFGDQYIGYWSVFSGPFDTDGGPGGAAFTVNSGVAASSSPTVGWAGDVDGDGQEDLLLGHTTARTDGAVYLFHGPVSGSAGLAGADVRIDESGGEQLGRLVTGVGDVNGDGLDDVAATDSQGTWLLTDLTSPTSTLASAWASFAVFGPETESGVVIPADLDGDGTPDLVIGGATDRDDYPEADRSYSLVRAWAGPLAGAHDEHDTLGGWQGQGDSVTGLGYQVVNAGDLDGDGRDDLYTEEVATPEHPDGVIWMVSGGLF